MKQIYVIYDSAAEAYMSPWFIDKDQQAIREFGDVVRNPETPFAKHPDDYTLFKIGSYNEHTGKLTSLETPVSLGVAVEYINNLPEAQ